MAETTATPASKQSEANSDATKSTSSEVPPEQRAEFASKLVDRFAIWSGVAGLVPLPVIDVVAVGGFQLQMLRRLSQVFEVPFSDNLGKSLIASLGGSMIPAATGIGAASALKAVPFVGWIAGAFVMPALSAGATYAIGKAFIQHFTSGGTLLDFNPPDYREFIRAHREMCDSRSASQGARPQSNPDAGAKTTSAARATGA
jgi:uncharacterized protein (DUF697 family)